MKTRVTRSQFETLSTFRHALLGFLRFSQGAARAAGVPPQQHQALLAIKGHAGEAPMTVGELAARLRLRHHSAVGLADRMVRRGLVRRSHSAQDRRRVHLHLSARGERLVDRLSAVHLRELRQLGPQLRRLLESVAGK